jgi:hypothetical protein
MKVIRPICRNQLTSEDVAFLVSTLSPNENEAKFLVELLTDPAARDLILDDAKLITALQDRSECLGISSQLYFYVLVRHLFQLRRIGDRDVADYVAALLAEFSSSIRMVRPLPRNTFSSEYMTDLLGAMKTNNDEGHFFIRAHIGNYALFLTGLYRERIRYRTERRAAPGLDYYEHIGQASFETASRSRLAGEFELAPVFDKLGCWFHQIRVALNDLADRYLFIGECEPRLLVAGP